MANTPIDDLIKHYEHECCDFSDLEWVTEVALRIVHTMPDSQARCLLYTLAKHAEKQLPNAFLQPRPHSDA